MSTDPDTCLTRIEHALARIEHAASRARADKAEARTRDQAGVASGNAAHETRRVRTAAALAELDRVIGRISAEGR